MALTFQFRRGTADEWSSRNPILKAGEPGYETGTGKHKIGDGYSRWSDLPYFLDEDEITTFINEGTGAAAILEAHVVSETPHPVYDDIPSMVLLFENGLL